MDTYILNGLDDMFDLSPMNGTNQAIPMNGTNQAIPMNGTNQAIPMNGTNQVIPMQGLNGQTFYVSPLALMDEDEVPMQGLPGHYDEEDTRAYAVGYLTGDPDALNGLFDKFKAKRAEKKARKEEKQALKDENRAIKQGKKLAKLEKLKSGTSFLDRVGGALQNFGEARKIMAESGAALEDEGIDYDAQILAERAALASEAGLKSSGGGGFMGWLNERSTGEKVGLALVGAGGIYFGGRALGLWGRKRGKRK